MVASFVPNNIWSFNSHILPYLSTSVLRHSNWDVYCLYLGLSSHCSLNKTVSLAAVPRQTNDLLQGPNQSTRFTLFPFRALPWLNDSALWAKIVLTLRWRGLCRSFQTAACRSPSSGGSWAGSAARRCAAGTGRSGNSWCTRRSGSRDTSPRPPCSRRRTRRGRSAQSAGLNVGSKVD